MTKAVEGPLPVTGRNGSTILSRCRCCGEWGKPFHGAQMTVCRWCGEAWNPKPMVGRPKPGASA